MAWFEAIVSIRFDLDYGPVVEHVFPPNALTPEGEKQLARLGFPDCNPDVGHDFIYNFNTESPLAADACTSSSSPGKGADEVPVLHGAAYYRQKRDPTCPRGYVQQGVVLLSRLPYLIVHELALRAIASSFGQLCDRSPDTAPAPMASSIVLTPAAIFSTPAAAANVTASAFVPSSGSPAGGTDGSVAHQWSGGPQSSQQRRDQDEDAADAAEEVAGGAVSAEREATEEAAGTAPADGGSAPPAPPPQGERQRELLRCCWEEICQWPSAHPHVEYRLRLNGHPLHFVTPPADRQRSRYISYKPALRLDDRVLLLGSNTQTCLSQHFIPVHGILSTHVQHLTMLWELLIAHEPLLVMSNTPSMGSAAALALASLITPLRFTGEMHPYLTIQHRDFQRLSALGKSAAAPFPAHHGMIVAGTNPFFVRAFSGWKNCLSVSDIHARHLRQNPRELAGGSGAARMHMRFPSLGGETSSGTSTPTSLAAPFGSSPATATHPGDASASPLGPAPSNSSFGSTAHQGGASGAAPAASAFVTSPQSPGLMSGNSPLALSLGPNRTAPPPHARKSQKSWDALLWGFKELFTTPRHFVLDHAELNKGLRLRLEQARKVPPGIQSAISESLPPPCIGMGEDEMVRKFFHSLTSEFLAPLHACFNQIAATTTPFQLCCRTAIDLFSASHFVDYVTTCPLPPMFAKRKRKDVLSLYEAFIVGDLFAGWLRDTIDAFIKTQLQTIDASTEIEDKPEIQIVDMFLNLQRYVAKEESAVDPDVVLVSAATATLAELAMFIREPLRDDFLMKLDNVKLKF